MRSIRSLSLGRLTSSALSSEDFLDFGVDLEDLKLSRSSIDSIKSHAFKNVRGVRRLDLSENSISQIDTDAFAEVFYYNFNTKCPESALLFSRIPSKNAHTRSDIR